MCSYGKCLVATKSLPSGTIVQKFEGKISSLEKIPESKTSFAIWISTGNWMLPETDSKYINHSCNPNCIIDENLQIRTIRDVKKGEELTIIYNVVNENENPGVWDPKWTFKCQCKSENCQAIIDKYITVDGKPWHPKDLEINFDVKENLINKIFIAD
jgi:hypothetical protein